MPNRRRNHRGPTVHDFVLKILPDSAPGKALPDVLSAAGAYAQRTVESALRDMIDEGYVLCTREPGRRFYSRIPQTNQSEAV